MNSDSAQNPRQELEARITALLLGELSTKEAAALRASIAQDPELAKLHNRLKLTIQLVRETAASPAEQAGAQPSPLKLSEERRQKLLAHFKTIRPKEFQKPRRPLSQWLVPAMAAAAVVLMAALLAIPGSPKARTTSQANAVINNLRQIDGAKQEWALENRKAASDEPTMKDLAPYLKDGDKLSIAGESYVPGKVEAPVVAEFDKAQAVKQFGYKGRGQRARLDMEGNWTLVDQRTGEGKPATGQSQPRTTGELQLSSDTHGGVPADYVDLQRRSAQRAETFRQKLATVNNRASAQTTPAPARTPTTIVLPAAQDARGTSVASANTPVASAPPMLGPAELPADSLGEKASSGAGVTVGSKGRVARATPWQTVTVSPPAGEAMPVEKAGSTAAPASPQPPSLVSPVDGRVPSQSPAVGMRYLIAGGGGGAGGAPATPSPAATPPGALYLPQEVVSYDAEQPHTFSGTASTPSLRDQFVDVTRSDSAKLAFDWKLSDELAKKDLPSHSRSTGQYQETPVSEGERSSRRAAVTKAAPKSTVPLLGDVPNQGSLLAGANKDVPELPKADAAGQQVANADTIPPQSKVQSLDIIGYASPPTATTNFVALEPSYALEPATGLPIGGVAQNQPQTTRLTQDGRLFYGTGRLDEAKAKLDEALARNPNDQTARYYRERVTEDRSKETLNKSKSPELRIADSAPSSEAPSPLLTSDALRRLEGVPIEAQAEYLRQKTLLDKLAAIQPNSDSFDEGLAKAGDSGPGPRVSGGAIGRSKKAAHLSGRGEWTQESRSSEAWRRGGCSQGTGEGAGLERHARI